MNTLDSPMEALAIAYLSYGLLTAVNSVWAWAAVITAAVGFWRIRGLSSSPPRRCALSSSPPPAESDIVSPPAGSETNKRSSPAQTAAATSYFAVESEGSPKGKFSVYFCEDDFRGSDDDGYNAASAVVEWEESGRRCETDWERMVVARMGDMGWYRCQDRRVFDGSVVRLWDGRRRVTASSAAVVVA